MSKQKKKTPEELKSDRDFRALIGGIVGMTAGDYAGAGALSALKGGKPIHWAPRIAAGMVGGTIGSGVGSYIGAKSTPSGRRKGPTKTASTALAAIVKTAEGPDALDRLSTAGKRSFEGTGAGTLAGGLLGAVATRSVSGAVRGAGIGGGVGGAAGFAHGAAVPTSRKKKAVERRARINKFLRDKEKRAAKKDAPNYRKAEGSDSCGNCKFFKPKGDGTGLCTAYDFTCHQDMTCDSWAGKGKEKKAGVPRGYYEAGLLATGVTGAGAFHAATEKRKKKWKKKNPGKKLPSYGFKGKEKKAGARAYIAAYPMGTPDSRKAAVLTSKGLREKNANAKSDAGGIFSRLFKKKAPLTASEQVAATLKKNPELGAARQQARIGSHKDVVGKGRRPPLVELEHLKMKMRAAKQGPTPSTPSSISGV